MGPRPLWDDEKGLEADGGDGRTTTRVDIMPFTAHFRMGQVASFF